MSDEGSKKLFSFAILLSLVFICGPRIIADNWGSTAGTVARFVIYILVIRGLEETARLLYDAYNNNEPLSPGKVVSKNRSSLLVFGVSLTFLIYQEQRPVAEDFPLLIVAYVISQIQDMEQTSSHPTINYGVGMACSFFEGYLAHVIPNDGGKFVGFEDNINHFESSQKVVFPVKRLFIVITKSLYCPPDLKHFNKPNRSDLPFLEAVKSLGDVLKDVAGVKNRTYRNSAYKIHRPNDQLPVYICAEFATPLHTLHKVLEKRAIYEKLCDVNVPEIVEDFTTQLRKIIARSPECRNKCEIVHYDDTNPDENLADVLLDKIRELESDFENVLRKNYGTLGVNLPN